MFHVHVHNHCGTVLSHARFATYVSSQWCLPAETTQTHSAPLHHRCTWLGLRLASRTPPRTRWSTPSLQTQQHADAHQLRGILVMAMTSQAARLPANRSSHPTSPHHHLIDSARREVLTSRTKKYAPSQASPVPSKSLSAWSSLLPIAQANERHFRERRVCAVGVLCAVSTPSIPLT